MQTQPLPLKTLLAFAGIYLIWGTTYLAIAISIQTMPPFVSGAIRFFIASGVLYAWLRWRDPQPFAGVDLKRGAVTGLLMPGIGNGLVIWAEQGVPSGITALIVAAIPIPVLIFDWAFFTKRAPTLQAISGIVVALLGVILIVTHSSSLSGNVHPIHLAALIVAVSAWSLGTLVQKHTPLKDRVMSFACVQMFWAAVFQACMATLGNEWSMFHIGQVSWQSAVSLLYLIVLGSIVALACYLWLLSHVSAQKVTTYALVNPVVALILGSLVLGERVSGFAIISAVMVLAGVALVLFQGGPMVSRQQVAADE
jgi:drug/metabolite transporter (DMT)-like permease